MVEFGEKVKQIREERGMTQQTLAEKLYVTRQAVSRWERGARYPELLTAKKIARVLNVSLDELLSG
ncbi:MAG: helix-turn-helix domain-containing protein, partial [Lachnospiraceae bacterium]|nr:helix-turn-helix domain-containing protein [Lachnospiraceae bacterium]